MAEGLPHPVQKTHPNRLNLFFQVTGTFAEFERAMIRSRVRAGLERAKARGVRLGRPKTSAKIEAAIRVRLAAGERVKKVAKEVGVGNGTVSRIKGAMLVQANLQ